MTEKQCKQCKHFLWSTGPTGRKRPSEKGECGWQFPWPEIWPIGFVDQRWRVNEPKKPVSLLLWPEQNAEHCYYYEVKK